MNTNIHTKRILCYGDSNTWGWVPSEMGTKRYKINERWPGILQNLLGNSYEIIEESLGGRTTAYDDPRPELPLRNGLTQLPTILESHLPLDLVIIMLGTTDTKEMMNISSEETSKSMQKLVTTTKTFKALQDGRKPQVLIVVPPIVDEKAEFASKLFKGGTQKAADLIELYKDLAEEENVLYLNPTDLVTVDTNEGVHIDCENHVILANLIYKVIKKVHI